MSHPPPRRKLIAIAEGAARYGVHPRTLRAYIEHGLLQGYRFGPRLVMVDPDELAALATPIPTVSQDGDS